MILEIEISNKILHFLEVSDYQVSNAKIKILRFSIDSSSKFVKFLVETLMKKKKPVVYEKFELEHRVSEKLIAFFGFFVSCGL